MTSDPTDARAHSAQLIDREDQAQIPSTPVSFDPAEHTSLATSGLSAAPIDRCLRRGDGLHAADRYVPGLRSHSNRSRDSAYAADGYGSPVRGVEVRGGRWHVSAARGCRRTPHMAHPSVMELAQIRLVVDDFVACFRFYRDVIGLTPQVDDERGPYAKLSADEGSCAVALQARSHLQTSVPELRTTTAAVDNVLIAFKVADLDACVARLAARGGHLVQEPTTAWGRMRVAYLRDPEGRLIELQQWLVSA